MHLKKRVAILLVLALASSSLAGCSGGGGSAAAASAGTESSVSATAASAAQPQGGSSAAFNWKKYSGTTLKVSFVQHFCADPIIAKIPDFEAETGIKVEHTVTPEANYFDKVSTSLSSRSGDPDVFMSGAYQLWDYSSAGYVEDLSTYVKDAGATASDYDYGDFVPSAVNALKWDGTAGHKVGSGKQLGLPLMSEIYTLAYNTKAFKKLNLQIPKTLDQLADVSRKLKGWNGSGSYGLAVRGARDWGTIHPGYMSTYANYGAADFAVENGKLVSKVNSPEAVKMTAYWVNLVKTGSAPGWSSYTWYDCSADLGAGKAAMMLDSDAVGAQQNWQGASQEAGNLAWTTIPVVKEGDKPKSNFWTWALAMNSASKNKGAAWYFIQYFTTKDFAHYATITKNSIDPCRESVINSSDYANKMSKQPGYLDAFKATIDNSTILFTPQPSFFETTTDWAAALQDIVAGKYSDAQAGMNDLKQKMDKAVEDVDVG